MSSSKNACAVILSREYLLVGIDKNHVVFDIDSFVVGSYQHVVWDARYASGDKDTQIRDTLESCCLIQRLDVLCLDHSNSLLTWLEENFVGRFVFHLAGQFCISLPDFKVEQYTLPLQAPLAKPLVISNVCFLGEPIKTFCERINGLNAERTTKLNVNIALSENGDVHYIKDMKMVLDASGIVVTSVNAIFYNKKENVFGEYGKFFSYFKKQIELASILGAKAVIYGSGSSRFINASKINEYDTYKRGHDLFAETMRRIGGVAERNNVTVYIKATGGGNYLTRDEDVAAMVGAINHPNVVMGPSRSGIVTAFDTFDLVEHKYGGACYLRYIIDLMSLV